MDSNIVGVSDDMRYVFFVSYDYDWYQHTFVRDLVNNTTSRVDITSNGDVANNSSSILRQLISSG
ncbi:hypothetical protein KA478_00935 [Patescibacteria group bacterium]|nr:hypothetical protein [Patescibacteria group bacterium]